MSGLPVTAVLDLADGEVAQTANRLFEMEAQIAARRDALSADLFAAIGSVTDKKVRNKLLELRRDLYNQRSPSASAVETSALALPADLIAKVRAAVTALRSRDELLARLRQCHDHEITATRRRFRDALGHPDFQKGLALSSSPLFANLARYRAPQRDSLGSRGEHIERGLLRYFTRMATKATPFGTFCAVIGGELAPGDGGRGELLRFEGNPGNKFGTVRLNKRIYAQLWDHLSRRPAVRGRLAVERNPTLRVDGDRLVFLTALAGREVFQRVPRNEVLDVVLEIVRDAQGPCLSELVTRLAQDSRCDTTEQEAQAFLDRLIEIGLVRVRTVVAEQEADWVAPLNAFLAPIEDAHAREVLLLLRDLQQLVERYAAASPAERAAIVDETRRWLVAGLEALGEHPWFPHDLPLYEDATAHARLVLTASPELGVALNRLAEWVALTLPLAGARFEMATMRHFFKTYYSPRDIGPGVPLLRFYEDFYREHFKAHLEKVQAAERGTPEKGYDQTNPYNLEFIRELRAARERLTDGLRRLWAAHPSAAELTMTRAMIESALTGVGGEHFVAGRSVSIFGQIVTDRDGSARVVVQGAQYFAGYGKYFSRFLYLLPERWRTVVFDANAGLTADLLAEICGDAAFNANLHPPLLPWEISYPTGQHAGAARQLPSADLEVATDPADPHSLILRHTPTGRRVLPMDLGFLNLRMRPPLYQLLSRFAPVGYFGFPVPGSPEGPSRGPLPVSPAAPTVICRPRITYEGAVILAPRAWTIPQPLFPLQRPDETDADYFVRVTRWRQQYGIPERAFVRVRPLPVSLPNRPQAATPGNAQPSRGASLPTPELPRPTDDAIPGEQPWEEHGREPVVEADAHEPAPEADEEAEGEKLTADQDSGARHDDADDRAPADQPRPRATTPPRERFSRDWHKPQFIDFTNPLLVRLFARLTGGLKRFTIVVEECLPAAEQLPVSGDEPYAIELILQLGFPATREECA